MSEFELIKKEIGKQPLSDQAKILKCYDYMKDYIGNNGKYGILALALLGSEIAELGDDNG